MDSFAGRGGVFCNLPPCPPLGEVAQSAGGGWNFGTGFLSSLGGGGTVGDGGGLDSVLVGETYQSHAQAY